MCFFDVFILTNLKISLVVTHSIMAQIYYSFTVLLIVWLTNNIRKQRHTLYMPTQNEILDLASWLDNGARSKSATTFWHSGILVYWYTQKIESSRKKTLYVVFRL